MVKSRGDRRMTKREQIEEMAKNIVRSSGLDVYQKAEYLIDFGYDLGSKETAEKIYIFINSFGTHNWERFSEFIKQFGVEIKE